MSDKEKPVKSKVNTVVLSKTCAQKIDRWIDQIAAKRVQISRKEFICWLIEKAPAGLSSADIAVLTKQFYDAEADLRRALREVQEAKKNGNISQVEVVFRQRKQVENKVEIPSASLEEEIKRDVSMS